MRFLASTLVAAVAGGAPPTAAAQEAESVLRAHIGRVVEAQRALRELREHLAPPRHGARITLNTRGERRAHTARPDLLAAMDQRTLIDVFGGVRTWDFESMAVGKDDVRAFSDGRIHGGENLTSGQGLRAHLLVRAAFPQALVAFVAETGAVLDVVHESPSARSIIVDMYGGRVALRTVDLHYDDATVPGLVGFEWVTHDPVLGDFTEILRYDCAEALGPGMVSGWRIDGGFGTWSETRVVDFDPDGGRRAVETIEDTSLPTDPEIDVDVTALARDVFSLEIPKYDSRVVAIAGEEGWVVLEAPVSSEVGEALLEALDHERPELDVAYVVPSHHHPHYIGALRPFVAAGATVVCPEATADYIEVVLARPRTLQPDRLSRTGVTPHIITVEAGDRWAPPGMQDRLIAVEAAGLSPHTEAHMTFVLPRERIGFGGDLLWIAEGDERRALPPRTLALLSMVEATGVDVEEYLTSWPVVRKKERKWRDRVALRELRVR